jgi:hypothetical protein
MVSVPESLPGFFCMIAKAFGSQLYGRYSIGYEDHVLIFLLRPEEI